MNAETGTVTLDSAWTTTIPRMVGETDVEVLRRLAGGLPDGARILEIGCWLGGLSQQLSRFGRLDVVDHFIWSEANDQRHPGILAPGESFLPQFRALARHHGYDVEVHEADYRQFHWQGGPLDLVVIDAPRSAPDLLAALRALRDGLAEHTIIAVKNGLNLAYPGMVGLIEMLVGLGILRLVDSDQPRWCNLALLGTGAGIDALDRIDLAGELMASQPLSPEEGRDPWGGYSLSVARIAHVGIEKGDWTGALRLLEGLPRDIEALYAWDTAEAALDPPETPDLMGLAEAVRMQCDPARPAHGLAPGAKADSATAGLRRYLAAMDGETGIPWTSLPFALGDVYRAERAGWLALSPEIADRVAGKTVAEITDDPALSGLAYMLAGARGYLGLRLEGGDSAKVMGDLSSDYDFVVNATRAASATEVLARAAADPRLARALPGLLRRRPPES